MTMRLNPYISFDGNARQAMEFYKSVFGGTLSLNTFGESMNEKGPTANNIMHAMLETPDGFTLMASDLPPNMKHNPGENIAVSLSGDSAKLRDHFDRLSTNGKVTMPMEKQVWGDEFGMCTDGFGIQWMVNIGKN